MNDELEPLTLKEALRIRAEIACAASYGSSVLVIPHRLLERLVALAELGSKGSLRELPVKPIDNCRNAP